MKNGKSLTLGIAKVGDLLINDKITESDDGTSIDGIKLAIPEYQRPYKWTAKNVNLLLDDIEEAMKENKEVYRVGTLILHHDSDDKVNNLFNIVDGQQRVITFSLILKCLFEESNSNNKIDFLNQKLSNNDYNLHNVLNNYKSIKRRIEKLVDERELKELQDYIKNQCELIIVITSDLSEAFQFFDSQNARGKILYPHDLLKAYHLREMNNIDIAETEKIVRIWEDLDQKKLSVLFNEYLYRLKEWVKGNRAFELNEHNIELFKGVTARDNYPFAQYHKGAFAFADDLNKSYMPFVTGIQNLTPFQLNTPIVAGKPFFEYTKHYFDILADIQNNDKYEGYFINDNEIVKTLDLRKYKNGVGNGITRLMFDTAILLYVDRFCPSIPSKTNLLFLDQFVIFAFVWAYSMRAQYQNVGWLIAQNYIMGDPAKHEIVNSFNMYKIITEADSPSVLLSKLADLLAPLDGSKVKANKDDIDSYEGGVFLNYLHYFKWHKYWEE